MTFITAHHCVSECRGKLWAY